MDKEEDSEVVVSKVEVTLEEEDSAEDQNVGEEDSDARYWGRDVEDEAPDENDVRQPEFISGISMDLTDKRRTTCFGIAKGGKYLFVNCQ